MWEYKRQVSFLVVVNSRHAEFMTNYNLGINHIDGSVMHSKVHWEKNDKYVIFKREKTYQNYLIVLSFVLIVLYVASAHQT